MRFVVQVCLDHAAHIYIWKVKTTESKHSASETISWSLLVVHVQGHSPVMPCTRQLLLLQPINVRHTLGYQNVLGQGSQTHSNTAMHGVYQHAAMRAQTQMLTVQTATTRSVMYMLTTLCTQDSADCM